MPKSHTPQDGFSDSDQQWFDRLSGKPGPYDDKRAVREADALKLALELERERLDRDRAAAAKADEAALEQDWASLQLALEREGLLREPRRVFWTWQALGGLAAAVVLSIGLLSVWYDSARPTYDAPPVLRGESPVRQVAAASPRKSAESFAKELRAAGLKPGLYQKDGNFIVDIHLLPEHLEAARPAFEKLSQAPSLGLTRVIFSAR